MTSVIIKSYVHYLPPATKQCSSALFLMYPFFNVSCLVCDRKGIYRSLKCDFLECDQKGKCSFGNMPFLECDINGMCPFWNVIYTECAIFGM